MKRKLKIDFGPIPALLCIAFRLASGHEKSQSYEYFHITQAQCNSCVLASYCEPIIVTLDNIQFVSSSWFSWKRMHVHLLYYPLPIIITVYNYCMVMPYLCAASPICFSHISPRSSWVYSCMNNHSELWSLLAKILKFSPEEPLSFQTELRESLAHRQIVPSPFEHLTTENPRTLDQQVELYYFPQQWT